MRLRSTRENIETVILAFLLFAVNELVYTRSALAYLDPTSGSMFFQLAVGGILAGLVSVKLFWTRITGSDKSK